MLQRCAYFAELVSFLLASPEWNIVSFLLPKASPGVGDWAVYLGAVSFLVYALHLLSI